MAGKPIGTIYAELDLDTTKYTKSQQAILQSASSTALNVEQNWKILGQKSDVIYDAMRQSAVNAYEMIKNKATSSAAEIVRAEEAKNAKIRAANEQQFGSQVSLIETFKSNWMLASAAVIGAVYGIQKAFNLAELGAQVKSIEESFSSLSTNVGISSDTLIGKLREVTRATIDDSDLMKKANRLIVEGFSPEQIVQVGEAARVAARLMATDVATAYDQVADSIVNLRERGLKSAGFVIDLNEAYEKYATTLGTTKDQLSEYSKQMAMLDAVYEKTTELQHKLGMETESASEKMQQQKATTKGAWEELGILVSTMWQWITTNDAMRKGMENFTVEGQIYEMEAKKMSRSSHTCAVRVLCSAMCAASWE